MNICKRCGKLGKFYPSDEARGSYSKCIDCRKAEYRQRYNADKDRFHTYEKVKRAKPETSKRVSEYRKQKRRSDSDFREREVSSTHVQTLRRRGLTSEDYDLMLLSQNHVCGICLQPESSKRLGRVRKLAVDHDHTTNKIRGLLCQRCNVLLGLFRDSPENLTRAANYLESDREV
jgi:hypothetical protein